MNHLSLKRRFCRIARGSSGTDPKWNCDCLCSSRRRYPLYHNAIWTPFPKICFDLGQKALSQVKHMTLLKCVLLTAWLHSPHWNLFVYYYFSSRIYRRRRIKRSLILLLLNSELSSLSLFIISSLYFDKIDYQFQSITVID